MKLILLHGEHTLDSYQRLQKFRETAKKRNWEIVKINPSDTLSLAEKLTAVGLFKGERLFIIEDLRKMNKKQLQWLTKNIEKLPDTLVVYHKGTIPNNLLKLLPRPNKTEEYKLPKNIFKFLDSFWPKNSKNSLKLFHETIDSEAPDFVFNLLARHLRDLYWAQEDKKSLPYPSWRVGKLSRQAEKFQKGKIKEMIGKLAEADIKIKTSKADYVDSLDFIIAGELE